MKFDRYDIEALRRELMDTVAKSQATEILQKLSAIQEEMYLDNLDAAHVRRFTEAGGEPAEGDPPAFTVRWDPTLSDGAGGWAVYLPTEHLLSYDGAEIATSDISGITVVEDADGNDTPWYSLDEVGADAEHVWLVVTVPESGAPSAELSAEEGAAGSGGKVVNVCVAEIDRSMSDAAGDPLPVVRQSLSGALHLGSGGGGASVVPDGASIEFRSDGDGHDGELQLKDFHDFDASKDEHTLADYLADGSRAGDYQCLVRAKTTGQHTQALGYVPIGQLTPPYEEGDNIKISEPSADGTQTISAEVPEPDGVSTELIPHDSAQGADNSNEGKLQVKGFADAPVGTIPKVVDDNGVHKLGWGTIGDFALTATKSGGSWTYTIGGGFVTRARSQDFTSGATVSTTGYVYLKVPLATSGSASIVVESSQKYSDSSYTYICLYYCDVSGRVADYRGAPHIQVWE